MARSRPAVGEKPLHWVGSSKKDLLGFPGLVTRQIGIALNTVRFAKAIYVLHAFQKKSPTGIRTARTDIRLIEERLKAARNDYEERHGKEADHDRSG